MNKTKFLLKIVFVYILDNRKDWYEIINNAEAEVETYLIQQFQSILGSNRILSNLFYETQEERYKMIMERVRELAIQ